MRRHTWDEEWKCKIRKRKRRRTRRRRRKYNDKARHRRRRINGREVEDRKDTEVGIKGGI